MPTPVSTARQCLTEEAAHALDEAVSVARRRGHGQTTSLHAVSALLSPPSSILRDACARARTSAYSARLQFKALDLCLSVSLDRVPSAGGGGSGDPPPVSNSLMAAIKRSQANQRRQPENFHFYAQLSQQQLLSSSSSSSSSSPPQASVSCTIKVELRNLILSILDDPVVSRVFGEAGFRSSEIKLAIIRPLPQIKLKRPPLFLRNLTDGNQPDGSVGLGFGSVRRGFSFPFSGIYGSGDDNWRRVGEVLVREKGRNPLLVGSCAYDTLVGFCDAVEKQRESVLPVELLGLKVVGIESDLIKAVNDVGLDTDHVNSRFEELGRDLEKAGEGVGMMVSFGDLKVFMDRCVDDNCSGSNRGGDTGSMARSSSDAVSYVVEKLTNLMNRYRRRVWLIGAAASDDIYSKFVSKFPSVGEDWDLQVFPITSRRNSVSELFPRSSLMESFVPFGGFFSTPNELHSPVSSSYQYMPRCSQCNEKCEQEIDAISKWGNVSSVADQYQSNLPSWLQMAEFRENNEFYEKTRDDGVVLSTKVAGLQKKWDTICRWLHQCQTPGPANPPHRFPSVTGLQLVQNHEENAETHGNSANPLPIGNRSFNAISPGGYDLQKISEWQLGSPLSIVSEAKFVSTSSKEMDRTSKQDLGPKSPCSISNTSTVDGSRRLPTFLTSQTTDLHLRISSFPTNDVTKKQIKERMQAELPQDLSGSSLANIDSPGRVVFDHQTRSPSYTSPNDGGHFDPSNFKMIYKALIETVSWQEEAIRVISQTIAQHRARNENSRLANLRQHLWLNFTGPDRCGKRKIAGALAEALYGNRENFIAVDLSSHYQRVNDMTFWGKTVVDCVLKELSKKPFSVVFLENVYKADLQTQNSLSNAIRTGKFSDSHGREVSINNSVFITTSRFPESEGKYMSSHSEERICGTKSCSIQIHVESAHSNEMVQSLSPSISLNKRKLIGMNKNVEQRKPMETVKRAHLVATRSLDLNLPADDNEPEEGSSDSDSISDNPKDWLQDFFDRFDKTVVFKPFDFDALSEKLLNYINKTFYKTIGTECSLYVDPKVMEQLLAAEYLSENQSGVVKDWCEVVLGRGFNDAQRKFSLGAYCIVKLIAHEGSPVQENGPGVHLPEGIIIN